MFNLPFPNTLDHEDKQEHPWLEQKKMKKKNPLCSEVLRCWVAVWWQSCILLLNYVFLLSPNINPEARRQQWENPSKTGKAEWSLLPLGFTCCRIAFSIERWYFLLSWAGTTLWDITHGGARPSKCALVWQPDLLKCLWCGFRASSRCGNHIFQIKDLLKWLSNPHGAYWSHPCFYWDDFFSLISVES